MKKKTSESNTLANKQVTVEQLRRLNIKNKGKSPSRSTSSTNQSQEESLKQQIKQLQQEVRDLKDNSNMKQTIIHHLKSQSNNQHIQKSRGGLQQQRRPTTKYRNN